MSIGPTDVGPYVRLYADARLAQHEMAPRVAMDLEVVTLETADAFGLLEPVSFRAFSLEGAIRQRIHPDVWPALELAAGFSQRRETDRINPLVDDANWVSGRVHFSDVRGCNQLSIGGGADQRFTGEWEPAVHVSGQAMLWEAKTRDPILRRLRVSLVAKATLMLQTPSDQELGSGTTRTVNLALVLGL